MSTVLLPPGGYPIAVNKYIIPYIISYHIISYHIISYHIISYHIISYHIISYHIISYHNKYHTIYQTSYHIISYHIISYHIISYHIISYIISFIIYHIIYHIISYTTGMSQLKNEKQYLICSIVHKITKSDNLLRHVRPSVHSYETTRLPLDGFSWNFISEYFFSKHCPENTSLMKTGQ